MTLLFERAVEESKCAVQYKKFTLIVFTPDHFNFCWGPPPIACPPVSSTSLKVPAVSCLASERNWQPWSGSQRTIVSHLSACLKNLHLSHLLASTGSCRYPPGPRGKQSNDRCRRTAQRQGGAGHCREGGFSRQQHGQCAEISAHCRQCTKQCVFIWWACTMFRVFA